MLLILRIKLQLKETYFFCLFDILSVGLVLVSILSSLGWCGLDYNTCPYIQNNTVPANLVEASEPKNGTLDF